MSSTDRLTLEWLPGRYAVCRLDAQAPIPPWALEALQRAGPSSARSISDQPRETAGVDAAARFISIMRTDGELSIVCDESLVPADVQAQAGFAAIRIVGQVAMTTIGIFARLTTALSEARVPVFVLSTFDTDYLLVQAANASRAADALAAAGCSFTTAASAP
jgi:hypothetical protein